MTLSLSDYRDVAGMSAIRELRLLGDKIAGAKVVHVNSTREGGGVAEILRWMIPLMRDLGLDTTWEVIEGTERFYEITKTIHNGLQGQQVYLSAKDWAMYCEVNRENADRLRSKIEDADIVLIHDPQPAPLLQFMEKRKGKWIWRAHIDVSHPYRPIWKGLRQYIQGYDASIFSMMEYAQPLPHPEFLVAPSIDPLSDKNRILTQQELSSVFAEYNLDPDLPLLVQISRFDRFKDPVGVIQAYRLVRKVTPVQLVLAGGGANDDPEGKAVLAEVMEEAGGDPDIHVLLLPSDAHVRINALQRLATIVIQKSIKEGFGLTVTEAMWKGKPVIGGDVGGIRLQVFNHHTGFLVSTPEGAAHRIRYLLHHRDRIDQMGDAGREFVRDNFLLTRHLREYLTLMLVVTKGATQRLLTV
jgi:trehalose synthase